MIESETPHDAPADAGGSAADLVTDAEGAGKLKALQVVMDDMGWDEPAGAVLLLAQKDDRTKGKSPEELASALREEPSLYDDLVAMKPGGALDRAPAPPPPAEPSEEDVGAAGEFMENSASMKGQNPKRAAKALGGKKPGDLEKDPDAKMDFMARMAGR